MVEDEYADTEMDIARANAALLTDVAWDTAVFPPLIRDGDEEDHNQYNIAEAIKERIRGESTYRPEAGAIFFIDQQGKGIAIDQPWSVLLSKSETNAFLHVSFIGLDGAHIVPMHRASVVRLKGIMSPYLDRLDFSDRPRDKGYIEAGDYDRQQMHSLIAPEVLMAFRVRDRLLSVEETCPRISDFMDSDMQYRRFFVTASRFARHTFEFAQYAIAGYDEPFRINMQKRADLGGYRNL